MRVPQRLQSVLLVTAAAALILGCGGVRQAAERTKRSNQLKAIGLAYHNYNDAYNKAPSRAQDLQPFLVDFPDAYQALQSGDVVVNWDARIPKDFPQGTDRTVLSYEKDVPTKGGLVLMGDASVRTMTAAEFQAAPRPTPKSNTP